MTFDQFKQAFKAHNIEISSKALAFINKKYVVKDKGVLPYKDAMKLLNVNLKEEDPFSHPWVIWKVYESWELSDGVSIASSYMLSSVLSSKSKRFNIDGILKE